MNNTTNSSSPTNNTHIVGFQWISKDARIIFGICYALIIILGVSGNVLVVLAVTKVPSMKTFTNIFIANLAVADLVVTTICCPLILIHILTYPNWMLGENMCYVTSVLIHLSLAASSLGLLAISVDRYFAIAHAQKRVMTFRKVNIIIVVSWVISIVLAAPSSMLKPDTTAVTTASDLCLLVWRNSAATEKFEMVKGLLFVLVFNQIAIFYYKIARVLWKRKIPGNQTSENQEAAARARKKVVKLLLIVLACFLGCWAPMMIYRVLKMNLSARVFDPPEAIYTSTTVLAMGNSAMNPILYALYNRNFRMAFKNIYRKCFNNQVLPLPDAFSVQTNQSPGRRRRITLAGLISSSKQTSTATA